MSSFVSALSAQEKERAKEKEAAKDPTPDIAAAVSVIQNPALRHLTLETDAVST